MVEAAVAADAPYPFESSEEGGGNGAEATEFVRVNVFNTDTPETLSTRFICARTLMLAARPHWAWRWSAGCHHETVDDYLAAGDAAMQKTELPQAEQNYQAAAKAAPNDPRVHIALGNLYVFEQKPTLAQVEFMRVLELQPDNVAAHSALGGLYESESQLGAAEEQYLAAVALKPTDPGLSHPARLGAREGQQARMG